MSVKRTWIGLAAGLVTGIILVSRSWASKVTVYLITPRYSKVTKETPTFDYYLLCLLVIAAWTTIGGVIGMLWQKKKENREEFEEYQREFLDKHGK